MSGEIVSRVVAANVAARAYRSVMEQTADDAEMRRLMLGGLAFDAAKDVIADQRATRCGPVLVVGIKASLYVTDSLGRDRAVVVNLITRTGREIA